MKKSFFLFLIGISLFFWGKFALAQTKTVEIYLFCTTDCPYCAQEKFFLSQLKNKYPFILKEYNVSVNQNNILIFSLMARAYGITIPGTPTVFIGDEVIDGFNDSIGQRIENKIEYCLETDCITPSTRLKNLTDKISPDVSQKSADNLKKTSLKSILGWLILLGFIGAIVWALAKIFRKKSVKDEIDK